MLRTISVLFAVQLPRVRTGRVTRGSRDAVPFWLTRRTLPQSIKTGGSEGIRLPLEGLLAARTVPGLPTMEADLALQVVRIRYPHAGRTVRG